MRNEDSNMKARLSLVAAAFVAWTASTVAIQAQAPSPGSGSPGNTGGAQNVNVTPGVNFFESGSGLEMADRIFDTDSDSLDLEEGTLNWKGRTFNLGNNRIVRARFERYLATPRLTQGEDIYAGILGHVFELLSVQNPEAGTEDNLIKAWNLLFRAAEYDADAGNSLIIANQVFNAWRVKVEHEGARADKQDMERLEKFQEGIVSNRAYLEEKRHYDRQREGAQRGHSIEDYEGVTESSFRAADLAETQARIAAMESRMTMTGMQAKLQFQSHILSFLLQRRFQHALISTAFYRHIFKGSAQNLQVGTEEIQEFMPISDFSPTVETLEFMAREAVADTKQGMAAVDSVYNAGERFAALERLQEVFYLGEHLPDVLSWEPEKKRVLLELYRQVRDVQRLLDNKDYAAVEDQVSEIEEVANDFPAAQILSGVRTAQRLSDLKLLSAKQAVDLGNFEKAEADIQQATEIWPLNPAIKSFSEDMANRANLNTQAAMFFDQIYDADNLRPVYERRTEFAATLMQDPERSRKLKKAIETIGSIDALIAQARELEAQDNGYAAWEYLLQAEQLSPSDPVLANAMKRLAPRVANYVSALDEARRLEQEGAYAAALTNYMAAQDIYPASRTCRLGIDRVTGAMFDELREDMAADAEAETSRSSDFELVEVSGG